MPLVESEGLTGGEGIDLRGNPLGEESLNTYLDNVKLGFHSMSKNGILLSVS